MSEKKASSRSVTIALGIMCMILASGLVGMYAIYTPMIDYKNNTIAIRDLQISALNSQISDKNNTILSLNSQISSLQTQINHLNDSLTGVILYKANVYFYGVGTKIDLEIGNAGALNTQIIKVYAGISGNLVEQIPTQTLPVSLNPGSIAKLTLNYSWTEGVTYHFRIVSSTGQTLELAQTGQVEESLYLSKQHVWYNTTGSWSQAAIFIVNTGGKDVVLDKISVQGQECAWGSVYYWRNDSVTVIHDLEVTSTSITGASFNITVQGQQRNFTRANDDLTLKPGWVTVIYIMNPDSIALNDVGLTVGMTLFTTNTQYYKETNVEAAQ